ncbi:hypothetical protein C2G38_2042761 [Gigaspora rosea]|uniref:Uncharacterized protein n=1 Tax=Gigaspora rosea TaxID=44941 RepID=A0A397UPA1_9GLOM|nr:hypothetical protein C2G38_2042761 [Gigaspora rosea]
MYARAEQASSASTQRKGSYKSARRPNFMVIAQVNNKEIEVGYLETESEVEVACVLIKHPPSIKEKILEWVRRQGQGHNLPVICQVDGITIVIQCKNYSNHASIIFSLIPNPPKCGTRVTRALTSTWCDLDNQPPNAHFYFALR